MHLPREAHNIARRQHGAVTTRQLIDCDLTRDQISTLTRAGLLHPLHRGVHAVGHTAPDDQRRWMAAVLATEPQGALVGHSAARFLGISRRRSDRTHVLVPTTKRRRRGVTMTYADDLDPGDVALHGAMRVADIGWILLTMAPDSSVGELTRIVRQYSFHHDLDVRQLRGFVNRMQGRPGVGKVRTAVAAFLNSDGGTDSEFEDDLHCAIVAARPGSRVIANFRFVTSSGQTYRLDNYLPDERLCIEGDPDQHDQLLDRIADLRRDTDLAQDRVHVIRVRKDVFYADRDAAMLPVARFTPASFAFVGRAPTNAKGGSSAPVAR